MSKAASLCLERKRLLELYGKALAALSEATAELSNVGFACSMDSLRALSAHCDRAKADCDEAHDQLEYHTAEHGCAKHAS